MPKPPLTGSTLGDRIREAYVAEGMTRQDFARAGKFDYSAVMDWEKNALKRGMRTDTLERIAAVVGRPVSDFNGAPPDSETVLDLDSARSPYPEFERYIEDEALIDEAFLRELRAVRFLSGSQLATYDEAARLHARLKAARRGRIEQTEAPAVPPGRRRVPPRSK
jgi:transcriptional regulator with XRE-family HTH domain